MVLKIRRVGEEVLRQEARPLSAGEILDRSTQELIDSMRETMHDAPGVGLAAPQIGYSVQLVLINPKLTVTGVKTVEFFEGCLSVAGFTAVVPRARQVRVDSIAFCTRDNYARYWKDRS